MRTRATTGWVLAAILAAAIQLPAAAAASRKPQLRGLSFPAQDDGTATTGCKATGPGPEPGLSYGFVFHEGIPRRYLLHMPPQAAANPNRPLPVVVNFHGMPILEEMSEVIATGLNAKGDKEGFIVVYPHALLSLFNAGACCFPLVDDVGFVRALIQELNRLYCIDLRRVYAVGLSGGGMMVYKAACEAADLFAAVASVGGARLEDSCRPSRPVPLIHFHGTADWNVPYNGGQGAGGTVRLRPVEETVKDWAYDKCGCTEGPTETFRNRSAVCRAWTACRGGSEVVLCIMEGLPHCWPGRGCPIFVTAPGVTDMEANDHIWAFFSRFALPLPGVDVNAPNASVAAVQVPVGATGGVGGGVKVGGGGT